MRMDFLEKELAAAQEEARTNAHASQCINEMVESGYLEHQADGTVKVSKQGEGDSQFDPMNIGNSN